MQIRPARVEEIASIRDLLTSYSLPVSDIDPSRIEFLVAAETSDLAGVVWLEFHGEAGLLRSLAVRADHRGSNLGNRLVDAAQVSARSRGVTRLFLLTETARDYFARKEFVEIARESAPASLQASAEFRSLCPSSAICMRKVL